jgi:hypothetical protein
MSAATTTGVGVATVEAGLGHFSLGELVAEVRHHVGHTLRGVTVLRFAVCASLATARAGSTLSRLIIAPAEAEAMISPLAAAKTVPCCAAKTAVHRRCTVSQITVTARNISRSSFVGGLSDAERRNHESTHPHCRPDPARRHT